jgi:hypothetical protein
VCATLGRDGRASGGTGGQYPCDERYVGSDIPRFDSQRGVAVPMDASKGRRRPVFDWPLGQSNA